MPEISHSELLSLVDYNPATGVFTSRVHRGRLRPGDVIGSTNTRGYQRTTIHHRHYFLHRLAWFYIYGTWPLKLDHRDGLNAHNKLVNLRPASTRQNGRNRKIDARNTSGCTGVCFVKKIQKYRADIKLKHGRFVLGNFVDFEPAMLLRQLAEIYFFGKFKRVVYAD